ncbi:MAG TPA: hypothetical protein VL989_03215 [Candidatus Sulfotelmatobacter sp.]|nr:hypothetical protein [Candidatus Sulfotelmatobacter sp.]
MIKTYAHAKSQITRFVFKQSYKSASAWALVICIYAASKTLGYAKLYNTEAARQKIAATFGSNNGLSALLGQPHNLQSIPGYTAWNVIGVVVIVLSIWAAFVSTKAFRGNEDYGRSEIMLAGQTTAKRAARSTLIGIGYSLIVLYVIMTLGFTILGNNKMVNFSTSDAASLSLTCLSAAVIFASIGALTSQLMATRAKALGLASGIFGVFFLMRAMADLSNITWLRYLTPLGWIENIQSLTGNKLIWLAPIAVFSLAICALAIYFAGKRDLGDSIIKEKTYAKPKLKLLGGLLPASIRLTYQNALVWITAAAVLSVFYGLLTKTASQALQSSASTTKYFHKLANVSSVNLDYTFLSIAFLIYILVLMAYAASAVGRMRQDEADGYLDNILTRPQRRYAWLSYRACIVLVVIATAGLVAALVTYLSATSQGAHIAFGTTMKSGLNILAPAILTFGIGVFAFGFVPRLTSVVAYAVIGWSFLIEMVSSGLNISHWILDTSIIHNVALAPAVAANWRTDYTLALIGLALFVIGLIRFNSRDLAGE